jgi:hypothetical protein
MLINQAVGDALADLLAVEAVLSELGLSVQEWCVLSIRTPSVCCRRCPDAPT